MGSHWTKPTEAAKVAKKLKDAWKDWESNRPAPSFSNCPDEEAALSEALKEFFDFREWEIKKNNANSTNSKKKEKA
jgi:hypothetical protein